jgi:acetyl-CoA carboxylase biotin carboxyl carrier protein
MSEQAAQPIQVSDSKEKTESNEGKGRRKRHHRSRGRGGQHLSTSLPEPVINMVELRSLIELISESGFTDFEYENADVRVRLRKELAPHVIAAPTAPTVTFQPQAVNPVHQTPQPTTQNPNINVPHPGAQAEAEAAEDEGLHKITSPIIGTFYRASSPGAEPFVKIGSHVSNDTVVCIIEAMKLMNEIQAETSGEVVKIYVENGQPVEYGQPLFGIRK